MKEWPKGLCLLVASLGSALGAGCAPQPDPTHIGRSAKEIQQAINVTDSTLQVVKYLSDGERAASNLQNEIRSLVAAVDTSTAQTHAGPQADRRGENWISNRSDESVYSDVVACKRASFIELLDIEVHIKKLDAARANADETAIEGQRRMLVRRAHEATGCALLATESLRSVKGLDAVEHIGMMVGDIYAIAVAFHAVGDLSLDLLAKRHIAANEAIVTRLAPRCKDRMQAQSGAATTAVSHPCVSYRLAVDALPKLKEALSRVSTERPPASITDPDEVAGLIHLTDSTILLLRAVPEGPLSVELEAAIRQVVAAMEAVDSDLVRHASDVQISDRADSERYARERACIESRAMMLPNLETFMQRWLEARRKEDEKAIEARHGTLLQIAHDISGCYGTGPVKSYAGMDAVNSIGIVYGELYVIRLLSRAVNGFAFEVSEFEFILGQHIKIQEAIVTRLAPRCDKQRLAKTEASITRTTHPCASYRVAVDALPKLRSTLAYLKQSAAGPERFDRCSTMPARYKKDCELNEQWRRQRRETVSGN